jgi:hypothetical protein
MGIYFVHSCSLFKRVFLTPPAIYFYKNVLSILKCGRCKMIKIGFKCLIALMAVIFFSLAIENKKVLGESLPTEIQINDPVPSDFDQAQIGINEAISPNNSSYGINHSDNDPLYPQYIDVDGNSNCTNQGNGYYWVGSMYWFESGDYRISVDSGAYNALNGSPNWWAWGFLFYVQPNNEFYNIGCYGCLFATAEDALNYWLGLETHVDFRVNSPGLVYFYIANHYCRDNIGVMRAVINQRDTNPPSIDIIYPPAGTIFTNKDGFEIRVSYSDSGSGIDENSFESFINGNDANNAFYVGPEGATSPIPPEIFPDLIYSIEARIKDKAGNQSVATSSFVVDTTPPTLKLYPEDGMVIKENPPAITATYYDETIGVNLSSLKIFINGEDKTSDFIVGPDTAQFLKNIYLPWGENLIEAQISDQAGWKAKTKVVFTILDFHSPKAEAGPNQTVSIQKDDQALVFLDGIGSYDIDNDIVSYKWLEKGNLLGEGETLKTWLGKGSHRITLAITDSTGMSNSDQVRIDVVKRYNFFYYSDERKIPIYFVPGKISIKFKDGTEIDKMKKNLEENEIFLKKYIKPPISGFYEATILPKVNSNKLANDQNDLDEITEVKAKKLEDRKGVEFISFHFEHENGDRYIPTDEFECLFKPDVSREWINKFNQINQVEVVERGYLTDPSKNRFLLKTKHKTNLATLFTANRYYEHENTQYSVPNAWDEGLKPLTIYPGDFSYEYNQWNLETIFMPQAWQYVQDVNSLFRFVETIDTVKIAIIDTGIDINHEDLMDVIYDGYDATGEGTVEPNVGCTFKEHGTEVAGVAAANTNNYKLIGSTSYPVGLAGIAWTNPMPLRIIPIKVADETGLQYNYIKDGIRYAYLHGADVLNLSLGGDADDGVRNSIIDATNEGRGGLGSVVVAAAGNNGTCNDIICFPANMDNVIAVGATNQQNNRAQFSNTGPEIDLMAPGENIPTTNLGGGYTNASGTSFAAPHVSGLAALILELHPNLTYNQVKTILETTADSSIGPNEGFDNETGYGLIRADNALIETLGYPPAGVLKIDYINPNPLDSSTVYLNHNETMLGSYRVRNIGNGPLWFVSWITSTNGNWLRFQGLQGWNPAESQSMSMILAPGEWIEVPVLYTAAALCPNGVWGRAYISFSLTSGDEFAPGQGSTITTDLRIKSGDLNQCHYWGGGLDFGSTRGCFGSIMPYDNFPMKDNILFGFILVMPIFIIFIFKYSRHIWKS